MSVIADLIRAGVDPDLVAQVAQEMVDAARGSVAPKTARQERNARYYAKKTSEKRLKASETSEQDGGAQSPQVSPPRDINSTPSSSPSPSSLRSDVSAVAPKKPKPADLDVLEILETCLSAETARDLVAHRKAKKSPMTAGAAKALAKSFAAFGDPEAAAAAMMANGWQGFNPEWMHNQARAGPAIPPQNDRRVYLGVDQQKQLLDDYYDRIEGKNREPAFKLIG